MLLKIHIFSSILINLTQLLTIATKLRVISIYLSIFMGGSDVKESAAVQKTQVQFLGLEDPLENIYKIKCMFPLASTPSVPNLPQIWPRDKGT